MAIGIETGIPIGKFSTGEEFPFLVQNNRLVFAPEFLQGLAAQPTPYGDLSLDYQPYLAPDKMRDITDWFVRYHRENISRWLSEGSTAMNILYRFRGTHRAMALMCEGEIGYNALYRKGKEPKNQEDYLVGRFFLEHVLNCQGIRNRTILTREEVGQCMRDQLAVGQDVRIMSVASGTSRAVLEAMHRYSKQGFKNKISFRAVDISSSALDDSEAAAKRFGLESVYDRHQSDFRAVESYAADFKPTIVEVCGLLDYFEDSELITFLKKMRSVMDENGIIIFSSVMPNYETDFIEAFGWPHMYERTENEMSELVFLSGLRKLGTIVDPLQRHCLAKAQAA